MLECIESTLLIHLQKLLSTGTGVPRKRVDQTVLIRGGNLAMQLQTKVVRLSIGPRHYKALIAFEFTKRLFYLGDTPQSKLVGDEVSPSSDLGKTVQQTILFDADDTFNKR